MSASSLMRGGRAAPRDPSNPLTKRCTISSSTGMPSSASSQIVDSGLVWAIMNDHLPQIINQVSAYLDGHGRDPGASGGGPKAR